MSISKAKFNRGSWIVTLPLVAGVGLFFVFVFLPTKQTIAELRETLKQKRQFIESTAGLPHQIGEAEQKLRKCATYDDDWKASAGDPHQIPEVFAEINELARSAGAVTTRFDPLQEVPLDSLAKFPVSLGVSGNFDQIFEFLTQLERLPQAIWVDDLHLEAPGKTREEIRCSAKLVIFADNSKNSD